MSNTVVDVSSAPKIQPLQVAAATEMTVLEIRPRGFDKFNKGERVKDKKGSFILSGEGTDMGVVKFGIDGKVAGATHLRITLKGKFAGDSGWARLRIEVQGDKKVVAEQRTGDFSGDATSEIPKNISGGATVYIPVKGMKTVERIQIMGVGPGQFKDLEVSGIRFVKK